MEKNRFITHLILYIFQKVKIRAKNAAKIAIVKGYRCMLSTYHQIAVDVVTKVKHLGSIPTSKLHELFHIALKKSEIATTVVELTIEFLIRPALIFAIFQEHLLNFLIINLEKRDKNHD